MKTVACADRDARVPLDLQNDAHNVLVGFGVGGKISRYDKVSGYVLMSMWFCTERGQCGCTAHKGVFFDGIVQPTTWSCAW